MASQQFGQPYLISPREAIARVLCELNVIWRVGVDKDIGIQLQLVKMH